MTEKNEKSQLMWHKPRAKNFFHDAGGMDTFHSEFQVTGGGNAISAPVRARRSRTEKSTLLGIWCKGRKDMMSKNQVYLYNVPLEVFEAWDEMGVDYKTGAEQVVEFREPGRCAKGNQGLFIQLDENNRTAWAKHFANAVQWVNEKKARSGR